LFAVVDSALLRPLPAAEPERLVWLPEYSPHHEESGGNPHALPTGSGRILLLHRAAPVRTAKF
jgi:hypothetical protein